jgi:hypothetical protein
VGNYLKITDTNKSACTYTDVTKLTYMSLFQLGKEASECKTLTTLEINKILRIFIIHIIGKDKTKSAYTKIKRRGVERWLPERERETDRCRIDREEPPLHVVNGSWGWRRRRQMRIH